MSALILGAFQRQDNPGTIHHWRWTISQAKPDQQLVAACLSGVAKHNAGSPEAAIETRSFALDQAQLAEQGLPAQTRTDTWRTAPVLTHQPGLFNGSD